jgi:thioredoxin:protein disulfide reductase
MNNSVPTRHARLCFAAVLMIASTPLWAEKGFSLFKPQGIDPSQSEFLDVDQAFAFTSSIDPTGIKLNWHVAEGHYLYLNRFEIKVVEAGVVLDEPKFSAQGTEKDDAYFGLVTVFDAPVTIDVPVRHAGNHAEVTVQVTYQGCADAGLCYPPQTRTALYIPPSSTSATTTVNTPVVER